MDRAKMAAIAKASGLPFVYGSWKPDKQPPMPYVAYRYSYSTDLYADGINYMSIENWQIELYAEAKDEAHEKLLEAAINEAGWCFDKREYGFDDPYQYLQTIYLIKTIG